MPRNKFTSEGAKRAGEKSSRKNIKSKKTELLEYLVARANAVKTGEKPITMEDLKRDSPAVWMFLRENAISWQEILECESRLSKYLHVEKKEISGDLFTDVKITIVEGKKE